jgi:hypothetical protein
VGTARGDLNASTAHLAGSLASGLAVMMAILGKFLSSTRLHDASYLYGGIFIYFVELLAGENDGISFS